MNATARMLARTKRLDALYLEADRLLDRFVAMKNVPTSVSDKAYLEYLKAARRYQRAAKWPIK